MSRKQTSVKFEISLRFLPKQDQLTTISISYANDMAPTTQQVITRTNDDPALSGADMHLLISRIDLDHDMDK